MINMMKRKIVRKIRERVLTGNFCQISKQKNK